MEKDWVKVYATADEHHAEQVIIHLGENNIKAVYMDKEDSSFGTFGDNEIYVHESNAKKAAELITAFNK